MDENRDQVMERPRPQGRPAGTRMLPPEEDPDLDELSFEWEMEQHGRKRVNGENEDGEGGGEKRNMGGSSGRYEESGSESFEEDNDRKKDTEGENSDDERGRDGDDEDSGSDGGEGNEGLGNQDSDGMGRPDSSSSAATEESKPYHPTDAAPPIHYDRDFSSTVKGDNESDSSHSLGHSGESDSSHTLGRSEKSVSSDTFDRPLSVATILSGSSDRPNNEGDRFTKPYQTGCKWKRGSVDSGFDGDIESIAITQSRMQRKIRQSASGIRPLEPEWRGTGDGDATLSEVDLVSEKRWGVYQKQAQFRAKDILVPFGEENKDADESKEEDEAGLLSRLRHLKRILKIQTIMFCRMKRRVMVTDIE
ncbi:hypothetical protein K469DRAFT_687169 [Zopfia rhizophila CBS 207.26]|uniref:Uncharacterized protein n=1 Tax=Zopfia rhizophila CBS 207.26 TaxID=1314779 RepID=A0A6A6E2L1_9PEZI|nr:hypothetical protein K469DRAFT_687169 [Zopfia rhizophila CBS 207.26]